MPERSEKLIQIRERDQFPTSQGSGVALNR